MNNMEWLKNLKRGLKRKVGWLENRISACGGRIEKKIVLDSFGGKQYSDNPRAISEKMHDLYPDYRIVWGKHGDDPLVGVPDYVEVYPINSLKYRRERATAVCYIRNEVMTGDLYKRYKQLFIQTWHGDRAFKKILFDSLEDRGVSDKGYSFCDDKLTDLFIIGSDFAEIHFRSAFHYTGQMLKIGSPRNDCLLNPRDDARIRASIGISPDVKILLYAPTLRRNSAIVEGEVDIDETIKHLEKSGGNWICLVRAHPKSQKVNVHSNKKFIDVSKYSDMSDLLMIADFLITDYSSSAGDFVLRRKPVILAQFDLEQYVKDDRSFYVDINDTGFYVAKNQQELNNIIDTTSEKQFEESCDRIVSFYGIHETGCASEKICQIIDEHYCAMF